MKRMLIFLVIMLVCSMTPVSAVETSMTPDNIGDILSNVLTDEKDTELTPEQREYLEQEQGSLDTEGMSVINNIQEAVDYLNKEYDNYNTTTTKKRSISDNRLNNGNDVIKHLTRKFNPHGDTFTLKEYTYQALVNDLNKGISNKDQIIIQTKTKSTVDKNLKYIRYMQIKTIDSDKIRISSEKKDILYTRAKFKEECTDDIDVFYVIIVPSSDSISGNTTADVLHEILNYQRGKLDYKIGVNGGFIGTGATLASFGLVLMLSGYYQCCGFCKVRALTASGEEAMLLKTKGGYQGYSLRATEFNQAIATNQGFHIEHPKCRHPYRIAMIGLGIMIGGLALVPMSSFLIHNYYIPEKDDLNAY